MVLIVAQFIGKRSKYVIEIEDPTPMEECMTRVSTRLASKEVRYMTYCRLRLEHLLEENGRRLAAAKSKERDCKILARLLSMNASLVPKDTSSITVEVLKGATKLLRRRQLEVADFLRLNVNRDQLLAQFGGVGGGRGCHVRTQCCCCAFMPFAREAGAVLCEIQV